MYARLDAKKGAGFTLQVAYSSGKVRITLVSIDDGRSFGNYPALDLDERNWRRLTTWVDHQRALEALE